MALILCPECGKQISDKAIICPHCGIDVQKVLAEICEKQQLQQKRRRKYTLISVTSAFVLLAVGVIAYLYSNDALNSIPAEYRKATENSFEQCESAIDKGDFDKGTVLLAALGKRTLTNRQAKRFEKTKKTMLEMGLNGLENTLAAIANNPNTPDSKVMGHIKKNLADFNAYQLDASQTERLKKAKENYIELQLGKMEKMLGLYEADTRLSHYYNEINRLAQDVREMELSFTQKTRVENAIKDVDRIKKHKEESEYKQLLNTIKDEYVRLIDGFTDNYDNEYFLYDIDGNGITELWIKTGTGEADYRLLTYTYNNGIKKIYEGNAGHTSFYQGDGYIISLFGQMGYATWEKLTYNGKGIVATTVFQEDISGTGRDYREPNEKWIKMYPSSNKKPIIDAFRSGLK